MQKEQHMLVVIVIAIIAVGLGVMPALSEQAFAKKSVSDSMNKQQQGVLIFDVKGGGLRADCIYCGFDGGNAGGNDGGHHCYRCGDA